MIVKLSQVRLDTERLSIRPALKADIQSVYLIHKEPIVNRYLPYQTWHSLADAEAWYARVESRRKDIAEQFVITVKGSDTLIGTCIVFVQESDSANLELGYVLARQHWGNGYMLEALREFVPAIAEMLKLNCLFAVIQSNNTESLALIAKLGFCESYRKHESDKELICFVRRFNRAESN
ncbi:MAG: GNAT family N-acetyltransferase [Arenicella sp.]|nr:GNAT family N-acetyltransferase [Arenicella sp.]